MFVTQSVGAKKEGNILRREQDSFAVGVFFGLLMKNIIASKRMRTTKSTFLFFCQVEDEDFQKTVQVSCFFFQ